MSNIVKGLCSYCVAVENIRHNILPSYPFHLTMFHRSTISLHIAFVKKGHWVTNRKTRLKLDLVILQSGLISWAIVVILEKYEDDNQLYF